MQLLDLFDLSLVARRDAVALECRDDAGAACTYTFGALDARRLQLAQVLADRGVGVGDRLALLLPNGVGFIECLLAALTLGAIVVPVNVLYREREIAHILDDATPVAVVTTPTLAESLPAGSVAWPIAALQAEARAREPVRTRPPIDGEAPALIVYTSGTTGRSKGAVLTHNNCLANTLALLACWRITHEDRYLAALPLFHVHGLGNGLFTWLASGCRMRVLERFDATRIGDEFRTFAPTLFFGVPTMYVRLLELPSDEARAIGTGMRLFVCGSAALPGQVLESFAQRFGHVILERYGMSETLMNLGNPYVGERRAGSVGLPFPGVAIRIVDAAGDDVPDGTTGELWVRGPNVFRGYWRRPEADAEAFVAATDAPGRAAWFRTGDLAERAADGYVSLRGRRTDLIISGGFNIYPREIEELLLECPGIREAVVVGVADARRGELPVAYVVADDDEAVAALDARCRASLASFKVPRAYVRIAALPRTALGKVQKHLLPPWAAA
jgi:malonyl-CoA/methylmalonyl-CoA synthetase